MAITPLSVSPGSRVPRSVMPTSVVAALVSVTMSARPAIGITRTWDGGGGNQSWHTPANWNPDGVPVDGDDVVIDLPAQSINVTYSSGSVAIMSLQCTEQLTINGGTLAIDGESQIRSLTAFVGIIEGAGDITITEQMQWLSTNVRGTGRLIVDQQATLNLTGNGRSFSRPVDLFGTTNWTTGGLTFTTDATEMNNYGTFTINATTEILRATSAFTSAVFNNHGTLIKAGAEAGGFSNCCNTVLVTFNNSGSVFVNQGRLTISQGVNSGPFQVTGPPGTELDIWSALPLLFQSTATIAGNGNVLFGIGFSGQITCDAPIAITGTVSVLGGPININADFSANDVVVPGTIDEGLLFNGPSTTIGTLSMIEPGTQPRVSFSSPATTIATLTFNTGEIAGTGVVNITNSMVASPNHYLNSLTMSGTGSIIVKEGATATIGPMALNRLLETRGAAFITFNTITMNNGRLRNLGTMTMSGGSHSQIIRGPGGGSAIVENNGTLTQTGGLVEWVGSNGGATLENAGTVNLNGGLMWLNGGGVNAGTIHIAAGTVLYFGATMQHEPSSYFGGPGRVWFLDGTHDFQGTYDCTGVTELAELAEVTIGNTFTPNGLVLIQGALTVNAQQWWEGFNLLNGALTGSGDIHVSDLAIVRAFHGGLGRTIIARDAMLLVPSSFGAIPTIARFVESFGTIVWQSPVLNFSDGTILSHGNATAGQFSNQVATGVDGASAWINAGTFEKIEDTTVTIGDGTESLAFHNDGALNIEAGSMELLSDGDGSGAISIAADAILRVGGSQRVGTCNTSGILHITASGDLTCSDSLILHPASTLQVNRDGNPGPVILAGASATVAGDLIATFAPQPLPETVVSLVTVANGDLAGAFEGVMLAPESVLIYKDQALLWKIFRRGDVDNDGDTDVDDLIAVILAWGPCPAPPVLCAADVNDDGFVDVDDLVLVIVSWG